MQKENSIDCTKCTVEHCIECEKDPGKCTKCEDGYFTYTFNEIS